MIEALSEGVDKGSEFQVRLPLAKRPFKVESKKAPKASATAGAKRVLVVDDRQDVAESLAMLLQSLGAEVRAVFDGATALTVVAEFKPDLAIIDISMPGMDGNELARRIRNLPEGQKLLLVAESGLTQDKQTQKGAEDVFDRHFVKPIDSDALSDLLASRPRLCGQLSEP